MARKDVWVLAIWTTAAFIGMVICELILPAAIWTVVYCPRSTNQELIKYAPAN
ncbi:hypothetical protein [Escherichia phage HH3]